MTLATGSHRAADPTGDSLVLLVRVSRDGRRYAHYMSQPLGTVTLIDGAKP